MIGNGYYPDIQISTHPSISKLKAIEIARNQYSDPQSTELKNGILTIIPIELAESFKFRLAWKIELFYQTNLLNSRLFFIDALSGDIIRTRDIIANNGINGTVEGHIWLTPPTYGNIPPSTKVPYPYLVVKLYETQYEDVTDLNGNYHLMQGQPGIDQVYSTFENEDIKLQVTDQNHSIDEYLSVNPSWSWDDTLNHGGEYNVFYWLNNMHAYFEDNFYYDILGDQKVIVSMYSTFTGAWGSYMNFDDSPYDVRNNFTICHEYTHCTQGDIGLTYIFTNESGAFCEGTADYFSCSVLDDPKQSTIPCWSLDEHCDLYLYEHYEEGEDPHKNGIIIAKAMWTFRMQLGDAILADGLMLEAMNILSNFPDHGADGTKEFSNFVMALLIADDNDDDPSNGTPHQTTIFNSFGNMHHIYPSGYILSDDIVGNVILKYDTYITDNVIVNNNATLTIEIGSTIKFIGYNSIHIREGSKIIAEGTESNPILFMSETGNNPQSWKNIYVHGSHNRFKWCEFEYGNWAIKFTGKDNPTEDNLVVNCTFHDNDQAIRIHNNEATISDCNIYDNRHALVCYSNTEVEFTSNHIHDNERDGIYSWSGNNLWFRWNVIEGNGPGFTSNGIYTYYGDEIWLGNYKDAGFNTVRDNYQNEIYAASGDPYVCINYYTNTIENAIYDTDGASDNFYEVKNYSGNTWIYACYCWWGNDNTPQVSGDVLTSPKLTSKPSWVPDENGGSKIMSPVQIETVVAPELNLAKSSDAGKNSNTGIKFCTDDIEKRIAELKKIINENPRSAEAEKALTDLYAIIRSDFKDNTLNRKNSFYSFLENLFNNNKTSKIGSLALQKMIIWKQLDNENTTSIKLSEIGLNILSDEDRMGVLENLVMLYIENKNLDMAKNYLDECKEKYNYDEAGIEFLEEEIADVSIEMSKRKNIAKGNEQQASQDTTDEDIVKKLALEQNYPNPGNPSTTIHYHLPRSGQVTLKIINVLGQEIKTLVDTKKTAGSYTVIWDGTNNQGNQVTSGIYLYLLQTKNKVITRKMLLMK